MRIDETDQAIIAALQHDGRRAFSQLAKDAKVSEGVVRYRVQRLQKAGILQIVGVTDPLKIGFDVMAMIGIKVTPGQLNGVIDHITDIPETSYVASLAGSFDLIVEVICKDTAHFSEMLTNRLLKTPGVADAQSFLLMGIHKMTYGWGTGQRPWSRNGATTDAEATRPNATEV